MTILAELNTLLNNLLIQVETGKLSDKALEEYVVGLTVDEVNAIETDDAGYLTQEDLVSSVTVNISAYQQIIERAAAAAVEVK